MTYPFPPELDRLVREGLATGEYASTDDLLIEAVLALRQRDDALLGIQDGLADLEAGRVRSLRDVDADLRKKHAIVRDS